MSCCCSPEPASVSESTSVAAEAVSWATSVSAAGCAVAFAAFCGIGISTNCRTAGIGRQYGERHGTHGEVFGVHIAAEFQAGCGFSSCGDYGIGTLRGHRNGVVSGNIIGYLRRHR